MDSLIFELIKWSCGGDQKHMSSKSCLLVKVGEFCINMLDVPQVIKGPKLLGRKELYLLQAQNMINSLKMYFENRQQPVLMCSIVKFEKE